MMENQNSIDIKIPKKLSFLYTKKSRYKVLHGGRGSAKTESIARVLIILALQKKIRVLCTRQVQVSIKDSVYKVLETIIQEMNFGKYFKILADRIKSVNGSEFFFKGISTGIDEIKSMKGVNICWVEEADSVTEKSWDTLIPTIREEGSEIWVSFNPNLKSDNTYQRFVENPTSDCIVVEINYKDNPFFPEVLRLEMEKMKKENYPRYLHIWEGQPNTECGNLISLKDFVRYDEPPKDFSYVYITADTAFSEKKRADNSVFLLNGVKDGHLYFLDAYCKKVTFPDLRRDMKNFYLQSKMLYPNFSSIFIENKASGISLIQQLREENLPIMEMSPTVHNAELKKDIISDKYTRFLEIESEIKCGRVHIPNKAHWLPEFEYECESFTGGKQDAHDDFVDCMIYGIKKFRTSQEVNWTEVENEFY